MTDGELVVFCEQFRTGILGGRPSANTCFMVCAPLVTMLAGVGVSCGMTSGNVSIGRGVTINHFWITLDDGRILDPTADQFNSVLGLWMPPVYLGVPVVGIHIYRDIKRPDRVAKAHVVKPVKPAAVAQPLAPPPKIKKPPSMIFHAPGLRPVPQAFCNGLVAVLNDVDAAKKANRERFDTDPV